MLLEHELRDTTKDTTPPKILLRFAVFGRNSLDAQHIHIPEHFYNNPETELMLFSKRCLAGLAVLALLAGTNHVQSIRAAEGEDGGHKGFIVSFEDAKTKATSDEK